MLFISQYFNRCSCGECVPMEGEEDSMCCQEVAAIIAKQKNKRCTTKTPNFKHACLNEAVLRIALASRKHDGFRPSYPIKR